MPGLPFTQLPATKPKESPFTIVDNQLMDLRKTTQQAENRLRRVPMSNQQYAGEILQLQGQYDAGRNKILGIKKNMALVKSLIDQGSITPEAGEEAMWKLALPDDVQRAMFQKPEKPVDLGTPIPLDTPDAPGVRTKLLNTMSQYSDPAVIQEGAAKWFASRKPVQGALINQYAKFRNEIGYKALSPIVQKQIDDMWDSLQSDRKLENPEWDWDPTSREVKTMRPYGPLQEAMSDRISPLARSVSKEKPEGTLSKVLKTVAASNFSPVGVGGLTTKQKKILDRTTAIDILREVDGDKEKARELARSRGYGI